MSSIFKKLRAKPAVSAITILSFFTFGITSAYAGNTPESVPGKSSDPRCLTSSNASQVAKGAVTKSPMKNCQKEDGNSPETAGSSAWQIKRDYPGSVSGLYWIKNANINTGIPFQIYADMETDGGGWTLIVANSTYGWTYGQALLTNQSTPPSDPTNLSALNSRYSILSYADYIKKSSSGFQYRMDAGNLKTCGGIWTANAPYSFVSTSNQNTNISLKVKWGDLAKTNTWYYNESGIEARMPWLSNSNWGLLTTSTSPDGEWWGTLIQAGDWEGGAGTVTTPWISYLGWGQEIPENHVEPCSRPAIVWYWVR